MIGRRTLWTRGGAAVLLLALAAFTWITVTGLESRSRAVVIARFVDSSPLVVGNKVQIHGVEIGTITEIRLVAGQSQVQMSVDRSVLPLHADATARIEPVSLLGERFVALSQGSPSAPILPEPALIEATRTGSSTDVDQLLDTFDDPTSAALASVVTTLGDSVAGQGDAVARSLELLAPTLHQTDQLSALLDDQNAVLDLLIVSAQRTATSAARPLDSLVDSAQRTLGVVALNRRAMNDALVQLPGTLSSARVTLAQLGETAANTTTVLSGLRPTTDHLTEISRELSDFSDAAHPALASLPPLLHRSEDLVHSASPVVADLGPAARSLSGIAGSTGELSDELLRHAPGTRSGLDNLLTGAGNWAMATSGYDGLAHYFRAALVATPTTGANTARGLLPTALNPAQERGMVESLLGGGN